MMVQHIKVFIVGLCIQCMKEDKASKPESKPSSDTDDFYGIRLSDVADYRSWRAYKRLNETK